MIKRLLPMIILSITLSGCGQFVSEQDLSPEKLLTLVEDGRFTDATAQIKQKIATEEMTPLDIWQWQFEIDRMARIRQDFSLDKTTAYEKVREFYSDFTDEQLAAWERTNALENMTIDGEQLFFYAAPRNLFRIDKEAQEALNSIKGRQSDSLDRFLGWFIPQTVKSAKKSNRTLVDPVKMKYRYTITIKPDEIPDGEIARVWMPYPRANAKHTDIKLISVSQPEYTISPDSYPHKSIYMEKQVVKGEPTIFSYELSYTSYNQWFGFDPEKLKPYDKGSDLYTLYTSERDSHVIFTDDIKRITDSLTAGESNPYYKVKSIYSWICDNFPWASAREYSTLRNIPQYVLDNKHGDCGQVALLFITMARYAGVPTKWQSGWMMHPGNLNLHDWAEVYYEGIGWVPVDQSFGKTYLASDNEDALYFFTRGLDAYRLIVNDDFSGDLFPAKTHPRSETVDFQRGEVEWRGENLYFGRWRYKMEREFVN